MHAQRDGELDGREDLLRCLMYRPPQYLIVARFADDKKLSRLESHFYQKANDEFTEGMKTADRLVDLTRGAALVSIYLFSQARYHEVTGFVLGAMSTVLTRCFAVGLGLYWPACPVSYCTQGNISGSDAPIFLVWPLAVVCIRSAARP